MLLLLNMDNMHFLYNSLQLRIRPEDVADVIMELVGNDMSVYERAILEKAAKGALARNVHSYTSMAQSFSRAIGAERQVKKAIELFKLDEPARDYNIVDNIKEFIVTVSPLIGKNPAYNDFSADRLNREQRMSHGIDLSKRSYNKRWRLLKRLENKLEKFIRELRKHEFQLVSKHGLAHRIKHEDFFSDINTACFIAYYNARCNVRSKFTFQGQDRPFDEISEMLLARCGDSANWWAIAHIYTAQSVLIHLTDEQKGILLGEWTTILQDISALLRDLWSENLINKATMIVRRGNDSSTWNNTAGAWNKARDNWIDLIFALGMDELLNEICFGKVMRLMAGDLAYGHTMLGGGLDPNTYVWDALPFPWEVIEGKAQCTRIMIFEECRKAKVDPVKSGWIAPRERSVAKFTPTPELVHGVVISNPFLASVLKKHKYYSGKNAKPINPEKN